MQIKISNKPGTAINNSMIGLFLEDINYGVDGGLYAEMIENRSFEFVEASGVKEAYETKFDGLYGWSSYPDSSDAVSLQIRSSRPLNEKNPHYLELAASEKKTAFTNKAYDGVCIKKGNSYHVSLYARAKDYKGQIRVFVEKDGKWIAESVIAEMVTDEWVNYQTDLIAKEDGVYGAFVIQLSDFGTVDFDFISMMPSDAVMGIFRRDLAELLKELKPGFLRFPGGCVVEGNTLKNRYRWKESIGKVEERKTNWNRWAVHGNEGEKRKGIYSHYNQSLGIGYFEYFLLCEYLGAKPLPVMNAGLACQYQSREIVPVNHPDFQEYINDVLDLIEFANGPVDSYWGRQRMQMGHPEPFQLDLIGIGNEQWETDEVDYFKRYEIFEQEIHKKYPAIQLIGSAGPDVTSEKYRKAWDFYRGAGKKDFVYAVDEHYYNRPEWFVNNIHFYDHYSREVKVFAGEYASHSGGNKKQEEYNTWGDALSEAAFLTGIERNAEVVIMASYAPLLARLEYAQWAPNLIWFDGEYSYGTPSYYVQKMFSTQMGTNLLSVIHDKEEIPDSVVYDENENAVIIKLVNVTNQLQQIRIETEFSLKEWGTVYSLQGQCKDLNTINDPDRIAVREMTIPVSECMVYEIAPQAFHVIKLFCSGV